MRRLEKSYGKKSYAHFSSEFKRTGDSECISLASYQTDPVEAATDFWEVHEYRELIERIAFLGAMNKRLTLFYRGQTKDWKIMPSISRSSWQSPFAARDKYPLQNHVVDYWRFLNETLGPKVYDICRRKGIPRWRGLKMYRDAKFSVIQHYELWPTPLIDITQNLRVACSFALPKCEKEGFLYVLGLPASTHSITFDADQHIVLARLQAVFPPIAKRPHYQDGFLVGRFPFDGPNGRNFERHNLGMRLLAKFKLLNLNSFWSDDFPCISYGALLPKDDALGEEFEHVFGPNGQMSVDRAASSIARPSGLSGQG